MEALPGPEIRERFLRFFEARGHVRLPSDSLIPSNDPTLLFTGAGMNQFKDMFLGKGTLPYTRVTTAQKCLRVPDLEKVGLTPRHHTFFEMLGHFSFGDYFKRECIRWEWDFFSKELGIPEERMVVTIYEDDEEAYAIWREEIGLSPEKIFRFGEKENFWPAEAPSKGPNGPCGPCSEIYYDARPGEPYPEPEGLTELPDDRFTEIGNCVFTQFDRRPDGTLAPLPQKNIDVGLGLERITAVLWGTPTNFETDLFLPLLEDLQRRAGKRYGAGGADDVRMRRIADHVRAVTFCIADGALPGNEGRGYVVRKILRRACRDGYRLGLEDPFLHEMVDVVGKIMGDAYPEVIEHAPQCRSVIRGEEEAFAGVYRQGMARLEAFLSQVDASGRRGAILPGSGKFAFQLHDTYGFPVDITRDVLEERGFQLDEAEFQAEMEEQRRRARAAMATADAVFADNVAMSLREAGVPQTTFVGYQELSADARIEALVGDDQQLLEEASSGADVVVVADRTPFYAQGGGQVGDRGRIRTETGTAEVVTTVPFEGYHLHRVHVVDGVLRRGQPARLEVNEPARRATERNHTATHLLHAALKRVLGPHVSQAGSEVAPERLRFDFTHGEKLTAEQVRALEDEVNRQIMAAVPVQAVHRELNEAKREGFVAMFGEKYGERVRTLAVGDYSKELCGGTHVANTGNIGAFRIVSETAISAGTRRIEAVTGEVALAMARADRDRLGEIAQLLKTTPDEAPARVRALQEEVKRLRKELARAKATDLGAALEELRRAARRGDGSTTAIATLRGLEPKEAQELASRALQSLGPACVVLFSPADSGVVVAAAVSPELTDRVRADALVKVATSVLGGGGGGRPERAQGKGRDPRRLDEACEQVRTALEAAGLPA